MGKKLFDFAIGNPPYQELNAKNNRQNPVYNLFMEEAFKVATSTEVITPARFLFDAGQTPKEWNRKMLNDEHFKVLHYEADATNIFPNTDIKGGVAITLRDETRQFDTIKIFTAFDELNGILQKVLPTCKQSITDICVGAVPYRFTEALRNDYPEYAELAGESFDLRTNILDKMADKVFFQAAPSEEGYVQILGIYQKKRTYMYVNSKYLATPSNFKGYKLLISKACGAGKFGEAIPGIIVGDPYVGHTQSFISIGNFSIIEDANNLEKYIGTKFARCLLSVLRITQDTTAYKWKYVPLQNFTDESDIDWSKSIPEIDRQLYQKYGLDANEIEFIETHVKEMN